jgi:serine/threonine protein kinase
MADDNDPTRIAPRLPESDPPVIFDRYEIIKLLGHGGMGNVYLGRHTALNRYAAIKTIRSDHRRTGLLERFHQETKALGQIRHKNVVMAHDAGETNGIFHLVMDYVKGHDLGQVAAAYGKLRPADACEIIRQAALGLDGIHAKGIHRDIKPSNAMLNVEGIVILLDLGLARLNEETKVGLTPQGVVLGTHDYMSPEQAGSGLPVDHRADLYSLGCMFFRLLAGHAPYEGPAYQTTPQKLNAHQNVPIHVAADFETLPPALKPILVRMCAKDPAERYQHAVEIAEALEPHCQGHNVAALIQDRTLEHPKPIPLTPLQREELALLGTAKPTATLRDAAADPEALLLLVGGVGAYFSVAGGPKASVTPMPPAFAEAPPVLTGANSVDDLPWSVPQFLFDRLPYPVSGHAPGQDTWDLDRKTQRLALNHRNPLLLQTGTTNRPRFTLEAASTNSRGRAASASTGATANTPTPPRCASGTKRSPPCSTSISVAIRSRS